MPDFIGIWQVVWQEISKNREKTHIFRFKISHFQVKIRPQRREVGQNLMKHGSKRIFRWFRISNQIFRSVYRSGDIGRSLDPILDVFDKNPNFKDEYLGGKIFFRHETWHDGSELSFLRSDQKLAKSIAEFWRKVEKTSFLTIKLLIKKMWDFFPQNRLRHFSLFINV